MAGTLSGGEQQQLAIARALMAEPRVILYDEPSLGLAPRIVDHIFELIGELRDEGVTTVLVEQNAHRALALGDRGYVLSAGRVLAHGSADDLASMDLSQLYFGRPRFSAAHRGIGLPTAVREVFPQMSTHTEDVNLQMLHPLDCSKEAIR